MGSKIVLTATEQHPFREGLNKLRQILNDPAQLHDLAARGLRSIFVVADQVKSGQFKTMFGTQVFRDWMAHLEECHHDTRDLFSLFDACQTDEERAQAKKALFVLRDTLNNKSNYEALVQIGPCALILGWDEDPDIFGESPILIWNFIPNCWSNTDYSINAEGETYFHS